MRRRSPGGRGPPASGWQQIGVQMRRAAAYVRLLAFRDAEDFLQRGDPLHRLEDAVVVEGGHPLLHGRLADFERRGALEREFADLRVHLHQLVNADAAAVAALAAVGAADPLHEGGAGGLLGRDAGRFELGLATA